MSITKTNPLKSAGPGGVFFVFLFLSLLLCVGYSTRYRTPAKGLTPDQRVLHVGIVVRDIETSLDNWVKLTGLEKRPQVTIAQSHPANPTEYKGRPTNAKAKLAFFPLENFQIELIQPVGDEPSHWKEFLDTRGEAVHHIAFRVKGMQEEGHIEKLEKNGFPMVQHGGWEGGEYGYMDGLRSLGVMVELIEIYDK